MKKNTMWKLAAFVLMFVFVLACTMKLTATATAIPVANVDVDYSYETITVETDDTYVYYTDKYTKDVSKWSACEVRDGKAVFDISWITANKTVRLYLCGDKNTDVISVDIVWEEDFDVEFTGTLLSTDITEAETWQKVYKKYPNFSEDTGYFIFTLRKEGRDNSYFPEESLDTIQWRKGDDGVWRPFAELDLKEMNIRGIKLEFQIVADNTKDKPARASSIAGVTVSKLLSEPSVNVSADAVTVSVKNGMEFSFDRETWMMVPAYSKKYGTYDRFVDETTRENAIETIYTAERVSSVLMQELIQAFDADFAMNTPMDMTSLKDATDIPDEAFTDDGLKVYVRDIGTRKKAASKIAEVYIPYAAEDKAEAKEDALKFSYGESRTNTGGIVVENLTEDVKYQVGVITPDSDDYSKVVDYVTNKTDAEKYDIDLSNIKWTGVKGGKMFKIANKKVPEDSYLVYRIAGEDGYLPSSYLFYGPMEYDQLTYAGIVAPKKINGQIATAVVSTNLYDETGEELLTNAGLTFTWERCDDIKADEPVWEEITGANDEEYEFADGDKGYYIRVKVVQEVKANGEDITIEMYSDEVGPIKYVKPTPAPTPKP